MYQRANTLRRLASEHFDVLIIGGGINGAVSAAALAAQGARVALIDRGDFAIGSSSNSSNLAWGGIKYLESGEFLLVQKLCRSRNHLMDNYPSRVKEIRFYTTINRGFRWPAWIIYCGALLYWFMGACRTQPPRFLRQKDIVAEKPVINAEASAGGVEYSDCYLPGNDARFVFSFIRSALQNGASVANYLEAQGSVRQQGKEGLWFTPVRDKQTGETFELRAKAIVNACGPYVDAFNLLTGQTTQHQHVFSKGVHLIVPRLVEDEKILAFFASDGRLFFVIPMGHCTCIGTTDTRVDDPKVLVTEADRHFILENANHLLKLPIPLTTKDIIAERCGVRPLVVKRGKNQKTDWLKLSRKHKIHNNTTDRYLSIFGGKITDCLNVGEEILEHCRRYGLIKTNAWQKWYGEPSVESKQRVLQMAVSQSLNRYEEALSSAESVAERWWRRFGEQAFELLDQVRKNPELLKRPLPDQDYCACEIALMGREECIVTLDDFLRRRTKIAMTTPVEKLIDLPGLFEVAALLFGTDSADEKIREYQRLIKGSEDRVTGKAVGA